MLGCWEYKNHYRVLDEFGNHLMLAKEESTCMDRWCCDNMRPFSMSIVDNYENEVLKFDRPLRCMGCCCNCCYPDMLQVLTVTSGGQKLGRIQETATCCQIELEIFDANETKVFDVNAKLFSVMCHCCNDVEYTVRVKNFILYDYYCH